MKQREITIVIPVYNEEDIFDELWSRLNVVMDHSSHIMRVLFIDDGSVDTTPELIRALAKEDERVQCIRLSRNFGHQAALNAGLDVARGDAVILMDGDLQDRPEAIPQFVEAWEKGSDVIYAVRGNRSEAVWLRPLFRGFYRILAGLSGIKQPIDAGIFGLLDRRVLDAIKSMPEHNRYFPGLRAYAGFKQQGVRVDRDARKSGQTRVGIKGLFKLAFDAIFSFSYLPIRIMTCIGLVVATGAFLYLLVVSYKKFISHEAITGWASTLGAVLCLGGLQLVMLGVVGEYIARIYEETKRRPMYIIGEKINVE